MRIIRSLIALALAIPAAGSLAQTPSPPPPATPPPPPPPPGPDTPEAAAAIERAHECLYPRNGDQRSAAMAATSALAAPIGSEPWQRARTVVLRYVKERQRQRACLIALDDFSPGHPLSRADRIAIHFNAVALTQAYLRYAVVEAGILRRLLGIASPDQADFLPASITEVPPRREDY